MRKKKINKIGYININEIKLIKTICNKINGELFIEIIII